MASVPKITHPRPIPTTPTTSLHGHQHERSRSILLVDDNTAGAQTMSMLLTLDGFTVFLATNGADALRLFQEIQPAFVLLDIGLPDIDGHAVAKSIREIQGHHRPTIIAITGWGTERDRELSRQAGCDAHFTKPVNFDELENLLSEQAFSLGAASNDDR